MRFSKRKEIHISALRYIKIHLRHVNCIIFIKLRLSSHGTGRNFPPAEKFDRSLRSHGTVQNLGFVHKDLWTARRPNFRTVKLVLPPFQAVQCNLTRSLTFVYVSFEGERTVSRNFTGQFSYNLKEKASSGVDLCAVFPNARKHTVCSARG